MTAAVIPASRSPLADFYAAIHGLTVELVNLGEEEVRQDQQRRVDALRFVRAAVGQVGRQMLDSEGRVIAAGVLTDALRELDKHLTAARAELSAYDEADSDADPDCPTCGGSGGGAHPMHCADCRGTGLRRRTA
jgi:hypothetical protein